MSLGSGRSGDREPQWLSSDYPPDYFASPEIVATDMRGLEVSDDAHFFLGGLAALRD